MRHAFVVDGSVRWNDKTIADAAAEFDLEKRRSSIYQWVREMRGAIIAGAADVERNLDLFLTLFFLGPSTDIDQVRRFSQTFLENLSFERKSQGVVKLLARKMMR